MYELVCLKTPLYSIIVYNNNCGSSSLHFFKTKVFFFCIPGHLVIVGEEVFVLVVVRSLSCVRLLSALWTAARKAPLCFTVSWSLLTFMSIELLIPYSHRNLCRPFSVCPQSFPASGSFLMSRLFTSSGQSTGASASASALPLSLQG